MGGRGAVSKGNKKGSKSFAKSSIGKQRDALKQKIKESLGDKSISMQIVSDIGKRKIISVQLTSDDYKHLTNDILIKKVIVKDKAGKLPNLFKNSYFKKNSNLYKSRKDNIDKFYYFKTRGRKLYFNVARYKHYGKGKKVFYTYRLHAIKKNMK